MQKNEEVKEIIVVPNVIGLTIEEAKEVLQDIGLELEVVGELTEEQKIRIQTPCEGINLTKGTGILVE